MLDHISLRVSDFRRSKRFYEKALKPLGYKVLHSDAQAAGFGVDHPRLWVTPGKVATPGHFAFACDDRDTVDAFHKAALAAGGTDEGAPGLRDYSPHYYGAFVLDPDGHNIEAVCRVPHSVPRGGAGGSASTATATAARRLAARSKAAARRKK